MHTYKKIGEIIEFVKKKKKGWKIKKE
jgi:hypothetical protein